MSEKNEFEKRTGSIVWRWVNGRHAAFRLAAVAACLLGLGIYLGVSTCAP